MSVADSEEVTGKRRRTATSGAPAGALRRVRTALVNSPPGQALQRLRNRKRGATRGPVVDVSSEDGTAAEDEDPPATACAETKPDTQPTLPQVSEGHLLGKGLMKILRLTVVGTR